MIFRFCCIFIMMMTSMVSANTGMAFLRIGAGSRATGMAEAYVAPANDASATYWNPAGLAHINHTEITFSHNQWIQDVNHEFFAVAFQKSQNHFGFSFISANVEGIERRVKPTTEPVGEIASRDAAFGLSYARNLSDNFQVGLSAKYIYERIYIESAYGFGFDIGLQYALDFMPEIKIGAVAQNLGVTSELKEQSIALPMTFKLGLAYALPAPVMGSSLLAAFDVVKVQDYDLHLNAGVEWLVKNCLALRAGYQTGWEVKGLNAGIGINFSRYQVDYAYTPFSENLGNSQRFAFTLKL
jgi:hypothetical protein